MNKINKILEKFFKEDDYEDLDFNDDDSDESYLVVKVNTKDKNNFENVVEKSPYNFFLSKTDESDENFVNYYFKASDRDNAIELTSTFNRLLGRNNINVAYDVRTDD